MFGLPNQLVQPLFGNCPIALFVNVNPVSRAWRLPIDPHAEPPREIREGTEPTPLRMSSVASLSFPP